MALAVTEAELQRILDDVAFTRSYGFRLQAIGDGECTLEVPFRTEFEHCAVLLIGEGMDIANSDPLLARGVAFKPMHRLCLQDRHELVTAIGDRRRDPFETQQGLRRSTRKSLRQVSSARHFA